MRRWYAALGAISCLLLAVGASSSDVSAATIGRSAPKVVSATTAVAPPIAIATQAPQLPTAAFGRYAVVGVEATIAAALLCYSFLQRRRATRVPMLHRVVRLRGPPASRDCIVLAS